MNQILTRAALWAVLAAIVGTASWIVLGSTLEPLVRTKSLNDVLTFWLPRVIAGFYFGGFVALVAIVPHFILFAAWLVVTRRFPRLEESVGRKAFSSLLLAVPFVATVVACYAAPTGDSGPLGFTAFAVLPLVLLSTWTGILLARLALDSGRARMLTT
jgi:hypothetical protein